MFLVFGLVAATSGDNILLLGHAVSLDILAGSMGAM